MITFLNDNLLLLVRYGKSFLHSDPAKTTLTPLDCVSKKTNIVTTVQWTMQQIRQFYLSCSIK